MNTPICDFVQRYAARDPVRLHMPGHKGKTFLGCEPLDVTEIDGAGNLYAPDGIIADSEANASRLFACPTFYSAEGSSLCIRAMLLLARQITGRSAVLAARNVHKAFLSAAALLDLDVRWLHPQPDEAYQSCTVTPQALEKALLAVRPCAVYLTSPDYLGNLADVAAIAQVCRRHGVLLLVDNAHGAYLHFLPQPLHPMDLGADLCCDSAHKTLPVLTGGAYLHASPRLGLSAQQVKDALALFGSSSPSYLILQSLDRANPYLETYPDRLAAFLPHVSALKNELADRGFPLCGGEPLKLTVRPKPFGYTGDALADVLAAENVFCELHDPDHLVCMLTPENSADLPRLRKALPALPRRAPLTGTPPAYCVPQQAVSVREACLAPQEVLPTERCVGRIAASVSVTCPPAVPIVLCGERIDAQAAERLLYYGVKTCAVVRDA